MNIEKMIDHLNLNYIYDIKLENFKNKTLSDISDLHLLFKSLNVDNLIFDKKLLRKNGHVFINISVNNNKPNYIFCDFDFEQDKFKFYDSLADIVYFSNAKVFSEILVDSFCLLLKKKMSLDFNHEELYSNPEGIVYDNFVIINCIDKKKITIEDIKTIKLIKSRVPIINIFLIITSILSIVLYFILNNNFFFLIASIIFFLLLIFFKYYEYTFLLVLENGTIHSIKINKKNKEHFKDLIFKIKYKKKNG